MAKYIIHGGVKLKGSVKIFGNKNSALPCIAASILTREELVLKNVPNISDVGVLLEILESFGAKIKRSGSTVKISTENLKETGLPQELVSKLRASLLLVGPLLTRFKKIKFSHPGGDIIGKRSINTHLQGFEGLGFKVKASDLKYSIWGEKSGKESKLFLEEASCTATENLIMASSLGKSTITLKNAAREPQVVDLCLMLNKMGAKIKGVGTSTLVIKGVKKLKGANFTISADYIEMATYSIAVALSGGEISLENCSLDDLEGVFKPLQYMGVGFKKRGNGIFVFRTKIKALPKLITNIWPGFPTDLMSAVVVLATQASGVSLLHDWMYESRMFFVDKLISMGSNITISDPHRVIVYGPSKLSGRDMETPDIRAGMALVLAALVARGKSVIHRAELIERGYGDVVENLKNLGAKIQRVD